MRVDPLVVARELGRDQWGTPVPEAHAVVQRRIAGTKQEVELAA